MIIVSTRWQRWKRLHIYRVIAHTRRPFGILCLVQVLHRHLRHARQVDIEISSIDTLPKTAKQVRGPRVTKAANGQRLLAPRTRRQVTSHR